MPGTPQRHSLATVGQLGHPATVVAAVTGSSVKWHAERCNVLANTLFLKEHDMMEAGNTCPQSK
jgi:hypothetical protein